MVRLLLKCSALYHCSEFSDLFDLEHFKKTLQADVRVVSSLPSTDLVSQQSIENQLPFHVSPVWIRTRFLHQVRKLILCLGLNAFRKAHLCLLCYELMILIH